MGSFTTVFIDDILIFSVLSFVPDTIVSQINCRIIENSHKTLRAYLSIFGHFPF